MFFSPHSNLPLQKNVASPTVCKLERNREIDRQMMSCALYVVIFPTHFKTHFFQIFPDITGSIPIRPCQLTDAPYERAIRLNLSDSPICLFSIMAFYNMRSECCTRVCLCFCCVRGSAPAAPFTAAIFSLSSKRVVGRSTGLFTTA